MDNPIISPWLFYIADILPSFRAVFLTLSVVITIAFAVLCIIRFMLVGEGDASAIEYKGGFDSWRNKIIFMMTVFWFFAAIVPGKETVVQMAIASKVTPRNIKVVKDTVKDEIRGTIDYIIEKSKELNGQTQTKKEEDNGKK